MRKFAALSTIVVAIFCFVPTPAYPASNTSSGLTANDFVSRVRVDMNSGTAIDGFYTDAEFVQWINEAVETTVALTQCMETSENVVLVSGTMAYTISASHYDISYCIYDSGVENSPERFHMMIRFVPGLSIPPQEERPKLWWEWEGKLNVWPVPNSDLSGTTVVAHLVSKHSGVTSTATAITTPAYLDPALVYYVRAKAHFKEKSEEKGKFYMMMYNNLINEYKRVMIRRDTTPQPIPQKEGE